MELKTRSNYRWRTTKCTFTTVGPTRSPRSFTATVQLKWDRLDRKTNLFFVGVRRKLWTIWATTSLVFGRRKRGVCNAKRIFSTSRKSKMYANIREETFRTRDLSSDLDEPMANGLHCRVHRNADAFSSGIFWEDFEFDLSEDPFGGVDPQSSLNSFHDEKPNRFDLFRSSTIRTWWRNTWRNSKKKNSFLSNISTLKTISPKAKRGNRLCESSTFARLLTVILVT